LYRGTAESLAAQAVAGELVQAITARYEAALLCAPSEAEIHSWENSIPALLDEVLAAGLHKVEVLIEYILPLCSKRIDVLLVGTSPDHDKISVIICENKQWSSAEIEAVEETLVKVVGRVLFRVSKMETGYMPGPRPMTFTYEGSARPA